MAANLRTVRLLDREPGKATETRQVHGVTVERGVPLPVANHCLGDILAALEVGESFTHPNKFRHELFRKRCPGKEFTVRKLGPKLFRVWRIA